VKSRMCTVNRAQIRAMPVLNIVKRTNMGKSMSQLQRGYVPKIMQYRYMTTSMGTRVRNCWITAEITSVMRGKASDCTNAAFPVMAFAPEDTEPVKNSNKK